MNTTIDNNQRIFLIYGTGWNTQKYVCNLADLAKCAAQFENNESYCICHIWDLKLQKITSKYVIELLEANQLFADASFFKKEKQTQST